MTGVDGGVLPGRFYPAYTVIAACRRSGGPFDDVGDVHCQSCRYGVDRDPKLLLGLFPYNPTPGHSDTWVDRWLCEVCAQSRAGTSTRPDMNRPNADLYGFIAWSTNRVLTELQAP